MIFVVKLLGRRIAVNNGQPANETISLTASTNYTFNKMYQTLLDQLRSMEILKIYNKRKRPGLADTARTLRLIWTKGKYL